MGIKDDFMSIYSTHRNKSLFVYIPVIYSAVISYGFYVLAVCFSEFYIHIRANSADLPAVLIFIIQLGFFMITTLYLIIDLGGMVKLTSFFQYKTHSRFLHDLLIGLFFLIMYNEIKELSIFYFLAFSLNLLVAAIWGNNLKEEAQRSNFEQADRVENWGLAIRDSHYLGACVFLFIFGVLLFINYYIVNESFLFDINIMGLVALIIGFFGWYIYFISYSVKYTGKIDREFAMPIGLPIRLFLCIINKSRNSEDQ